MTKFPLITNKYLIYYRFLILTGFVRICSFAIGSPIQAKTKELLPTQPNDIADISVLYSENEKFVIYRNTNKSECYVDDAALANQSASIAQYSRTLFVGSKISRSHPLYSEIGQDAINFCNGSEILLLEKDPPAIGKTGTSASANETGRRARRQIPYGDKIPYVNKRASNYRGQTQTQFVSFEKPNERSGGTAEAIAEPDKSQARVSGTAGMGQAQSQSISGDNCEECAVGSKHDTRDQLIKGTPSGMATHQTPISDMSSQMPVIQGDFRPTSIYQDTAGKVVPQDATYRSGDKWALQASQHGVGKIPSITQYNPSSVPDQPFSQITVAEQIPHATSDHHVPQESSGKRLPPSLTDSGQSIPQIIQSSTPEVLTGIRQPIDSRITMTQPTPDTTKYYLIDGKPVSYKPTSTQMLTAIPSQQGSIKGGSYWQQSPIPVYQLSDTRTLPFERRDSIKKTQQIPTLVYPTSGLQMPVSFPSQSTAFGQEHDAGLKLQPSIYSTGIPVQQPSIYDQIQQSKPSDMPTQFKTHQSGNPGQISPVGKTSPTIESVGGIEQTKTSPLQTSISTHTPQQYHSFQVPLASPQLPDRAGIIGTVPSYAGISDGEQKILTLPSPDIVPQSQDSTVLYPSDKHVIQTGTGEQQSQLYAKGKQPISSQFPMYTQTNPQQTYFISPDGRYYPNTVQISPFDKQGVRYSSTGQSQGSYGVAGELNPPLPASGQTQTAHQTPTISASEITRPLIYDRPSVPGSDQYRPVYIIPSAGESIDPSQYPTSGGHTGGGYTYSPELSLPSTGTYPTGTVSGGRAGGGYQYSPELLLPSTGAYPTGTASSGRTGGGYQYNPELLLPSTGTYPTRTVYVPSAYPTSGGRTGLNTSEGTSIMRVDSEYDEAQSLSDIQIKGNETQASASSQGKTRNGIAQAKVSGTYTGSFSAQAQTGDNEKMAQSEIVGNTTGAASFSQSRAGKSNSQTQIRYNYENGLTLAEAQGNGINYNTNTQIQAGLTGGLADAQSSGPGNTSSQAQIGFVPYDDTGKDEQKNFFNGGGTASSQSGSLSGQSETQFHGSFQYGVSYTGAAQSSVGKLARNVTRSSLTKFSSPQRSIQKQVDKQVPPEESRNNKTKNDNNDNKTLSIDQLSVTRNYDEDILHAVTTARTEQSDSTRQNNYYVTSTSTTVIPFTATVTTTIADTVKNDENRLTINTRDIIGDVHDVSDDDQDDYYDNKQSPANRYKKKSADIIFNNNNKVNYVPIQTQGTYIRNDSRRDVYVTRDSSNRLLKEGDILQPRQIIPGTVGDYRIPSGFRGKIVSIAGDKTEANASAGGQAQTQTVIMKPGTGRFTLTDKSQTRSLPAPDDLFFTPNEPDAQHRDKTANTRSPSNPYDTYVTITKSETGKLNNKDDNQKYVHTYYTKSSTCGYFTFTCNLIHNFNGRTKLCKPNPPTRADGTPC